MRLFKRLKQRQKSRAFKLILAPIFERFKSENELESRGYRPLQMTFDDQLKALIFYHLKSSLPGANFSRRWNRMTLPRSVLLPPKGSRKAPSSRQSTTGALNSLPRYSIILSSKPAKCSRMNMLTLATWYP